MELIKKIGYLLSEYHVLLFNGLKNTLIIAPVAFIIGLIFGSLIAIIRVVPKKKNIFLQVLDKICSLYVTVIRGTPVIVQLLLMYFGILAQTAIPALAVGIIVFGLNSSAYMSEIIRGGILSVDRGQLEASRSLGISYPKTMTDIILPQCLKHTIPTILNELIALLKETSVVGYITVLDITVAIQRVVANEYEALAPYILLALIYLIIVVILTELVKILERRLRKSDNSN